jgi:hypothetical protein
MTQLDRIKQFFDQLEERTFYHYVAGILIGMALLMGITVFFQYRTQATLKKQAARLNSYRENAQELLSRYNRVREQEQAVTAVLEQDKNFRIVGYLDATLATLQLTANRTGSAQTSEPLEHPANYNEITVNLTLSDINMRQLAELLREIEKNERIYTKSLEITKSPTKPTIDVALAVATLQPRVEGAPV